MSLLEAVAVLVAGIGAGTINVVVGSGTLLTFPTLLAVGYSPLVANVSNTIGLVNGSIAGTIGYRRELKGQRSRVLRFGTAGLLGGITGATLLLTLPESAFDAIVPAFIAIALILIVIQPRLEPWLERRRATRERSPAGPLAAVYGTGIYGGYFGAAQGVILLAVLDLSLPDDLQRVNALKNLIASVINLVAALIFIALADVAWGPVLLLTVGSIIGGMLGARYGRRLPPGALRGLIVVVGIAAIVNLLAT
jgi:uncharacterized membrane protein YfcA